MSIYLVQSSINNGSLICFCSISVLVHFIAFRVSGWESFEPKSSLAWLRFMLWVLSWTKVNFVKGNFEVFEISG